MEKLNITDAQRVFFSLVGHGLFSSPLKIDENVDWSAVITESIAQSLPLLAFKNYRELPMDEQTAKKLQAYLRKCTSVNINSFKGHGYLHRLMTEHGIPYTIIKGAASAYRYPDPLLRTMGDVDFYVSPEHVERAREIFLNEGFEFDKSEHPFHLGMMKESLRLEMHYAPISAPEGEIGEIFREYWSDICEGAVLTKDVFAEYYLPSNFHHGFILLTHLRSHMVQQGVGMRHVTDWAVFVNSFSNEEFVEIFETRLKRVGLFKFAKALSLVSVLLFGMPHKAWMGEDYDVARALAEDIAAGGNFGRREKSRGLETVFIIDYKKTGRSESGIRRAFRAANEIVSRHWPSAKKIPILYPIGWVYFSLRFLFKRMTGRLDGKVIESYQKSGKRLKLYESLNLFKPEE